jgi:hypothetical protein
VTAKHIELHRTDGGKLSEYKRVTINEFKGSTLIDVREVSWPDWFVSLIDIVVVAESEWPRLIPQTYMDKASGEMKPGKKGISLTVDQVSLDSPTPVTAQQPAPGCVQDSGTFDTFYQLTK